MTEQSLEQVEHVCISKTDDLGNVEISIRTNNEPLPAVASHQMRDEDDHEEPNIVVVDPDDTIVIVDQVANANIEEMPGKVKGRILIIVTLWMLFMFYINFKG